MKISQKWGHERSGDGQEENKRVEKKKESGESGVNTSRGEMRSNGERGGGRFGV